MMSDLKKRSQEVVSYLAANVDVAKAERETHKEKAFQEMLDTVKELQEKAGLEETVKSLLPDEWWRL